MKKKLLASLVSTVMVASLFSGCGNSANTTNTKEAATTNETTKTEEKKEETTEATTEETATEGTDYSALAGTTVQVYTHGSNRVLGEEKKDADGNTYRDESYAYLKHLAERFQSETGINVELNCVADESEVEPLFKVEDPSIDVFTCPNWSIAQWGAYAEPYCTVDEGVELYGEYATAMPNDGTNIFSIMPGKAYNQCVVYNEEVLKSVGYDAVPTTLDEFNTMCAKIRDAGITPISMHRVENWPLSTMNDFCRYVAGDKDAFEKMLQSDAPFSEDQPFGKTIKMYTQWKADGFFEPEVYTDFGVAMDSVAYGKAAMMLFGSWVVPQIQGRVPDGKDPAIIKFAPAPDFGNGRFVQAAPADNWAISKFSDNKDGARAFIEYITEDAQFIADSGFIANKKGVTPIVPDLYKIIDDEISAGTATAMMLPQTTQNTINNQEVLTEANLWADNKYAGLLFDALDVTKPDDWTAYNKQVEEQNKLYAEYKEELGVDWVD